MSFTLKGHGDCWRQRRCIEIRIASLGIDVLPLKRVRTLIRLAPASSWMLLCTERERVWATGSAARLALCLCTKEAVAKALGCGLLVTEQNVAGCYEIESTPSGATGTADVILYGRTLNLAKREGVSSFIVYRRIVGQNAICIAVALPASQNVGPIQAMLSDTVLAYAQYTSHRGRAHRYKPHSSKENRTMTKQEFLTSIEELTESEANTLRETDPLADTGMWDSTAVLGFISFVDEHFDTTFSADAIQACETPGDLMRLLGDRIKG